MQLKEYEPTKLHRTLRKRMEKAIVDYQMIEPGDRLLLGVSGGADSMALLHLFCHGLILTTPHFYLSTIYVDIGLPHADTEKRNIWKEYMNHSGFDFHLTQTRIGETAFAEDRKKNPCFICSMYRRQRVYELAEKLNCNKIVYGHHKDDIAETLLINIFFGRKIETMHPVQKIFKGKMHIIRPLCYIEEPLIKKMAREAGLPLLSKDCPMDGLSRRQKIKDIINQIQSDEKNANIRENIFKSMYHVNLNTIAPDKRK